MEKQELYLKTMFCCMACDGNIASEEIELVRNIASQTNVFQGLDIEKTLNGYVTSINQNGTLFLREYLNELSAQNLTTDEELQIIALAISTIEADNRIEYSEIKFFKKIRCRLSVSDELILAQHPDKEDFLLPDNTTEEIPVWNEDVMFASISLKI